MKVVLQADVSGTRNGQTWPPRGHTVDLPDDEAAQMVRATLARPVVDSEQAAYEAGRAGFGEIIPGPAPDADLPPAVESEAAPGPLTTDTGPARKARQRA